MAANDPLAPEARKQPLSAEDAERFASQIRPSWELLGSDGSDVLIPEAPPAGAPGAKSDTIIDGVPAVAVAGSGEPAPAAPIKPVSVTAVGGLDALPLPPARGQPLAAPKKAAAPEKVAEKPVAA